MVVQVVRSGAQPGRIIREETKARVAVATKPRTEAARLVIMIHERTRSNRLSGTNLIDQRSGADRTPRALLHEGRFRKLGGNSQLAEELGASLLVVDRWVGRATSRRRPSRRQELLLLGVSFAAKGAPGNLYPADIAAIRRQLALAPETLVTGSTEIPADNPQTLRARPRGAPAATCTCRHVAILSLARRCGPVGVLGVNAGIDPS